MQLIEQLLLFDMIDRTRTMKARCADIDAAATARGGAYASVRAMTSQVDSHVLIGDAISELAVEGRVRGGTICRAQPETKQVSEQPKGIRSASLLIQMS
jgi:hypothetical protein